MSEMLRTVTLWLAWYRECATYRERAEHEERVEYRERKEEYAGKGSPRRLLRLKMLYASSQEEAHAEMQQWLERKGLVAKDLERLEPSPYGLRFPSR